MSTSRVALLDWDGTLCGGATIFAWTKYLHALGLMNDGGMQTAAKAYDDLDGGHIDYLQMVDLVTSGYARGLAGRRVAEVSELASEFAESYRDQIMWFTPELIGALRDASIETIVITGSPKIAVEPIAARLGIDRVLGLEASVSEGTLTGTLLQNTARPEVKQRIVESFADREVLLAAGDSVSDTPLLEAAQVRLFVGDGATPPLDRIVRIPRTPSPEARRTLADALAAATSQPSSP
jgi:HAD superfamily phosphoserine phosphatase-like hydrolase